MRASPAPGFVECEHCGGMGFRKAGDFADRQFPKCPYCKGLGQKYLEPVPERMAWVAGVVTGCDQYGYPHE